MGTDIHYWVERKPVDSEVWEAVGSEGDYYDGSRNVPLFFKLAGVRISRIWNYADAEPFAAPRGLPADLSQEVAGYMCAGDLDSGLHSASWYTLTELRAFDWPDNLQDFERIFVGALHSLAVTSAVTDDQIRIVFAFDN